MKKPRESYHHGNLRAALISAAVCLIERGGEASFSLREAARSVGVSPNAAYRHFEDKAALLTAVAAAGLEQLASRMREEMARVAEGRPVERRAIAQFKAVGRAYVEFAMANPELYRLIFSPSGVASVNAAVAGMVTPTPLQLLSGSIDALVADGLLDPAGREGAELKAWSVVHGFALLLTLVGSSVVPTGQRRYPALEAVLEFAAVGMCVPAVRRRTSRSRRTDHSSRAAE